MQLHLQVSPDDFPAYWNASQAIAGIQLAVGANSPFLFGKELWAETRIALFEQATDTRSEELKAQGVRPRVWFGERWITSIFDLFEENVRYFPALLPIIDDEDPVAVLDGGDTPQLGGAAAAQRHDLPLEPAGLRRRAAAFRTCGSRTGCCRPGPTVVDMMANAAFYFGAGPLAGRGRAADLVADVVQRGRGELPRRRARRHRRPGLLAGRRHGVRGRAGAAAAAAARARGPGRVGDGRRPSATGC